MNQQQKSKTTKLKLKIAAESLFTEKTFDQTSILDITNHAGYAVGTFYKHWKRKEDLLFELWQDFTTEYMIDSAREINQVKTINEFSSKIVNRSLEYGEHPFIKKYFSSQYHVEENQKIAMTDAYNLYVETIYQQLTKLHSEQKQPAILWQIAIAVANF
ncbi:TetR/AcrR family transcriptional regulator [Enterococcus rivorum]